MFDLKKSLLVLPYLKLNFKLLILSHLYQLVYVLKIFKTNSEYQKCKSYEIK